jgi:error-prone DNA polymerase
LEAPSAGSVLHPASPLLRPELLAGYAGYVELHCHSYFSLLDGASSPEALVERAVQLGYPALALTDHDGLYGVVRFWQAAQEWGLKALVGAEVSLLATASNVPNGTLEATAPRHRLGEDDGHHLTLLVETKSGYANLCRLISAGQLAGQKGAPRLTLDTLAQHASGLICLSGCRKGIVASALLAKKAEGAYAVAGHLRDIFADRFWIELQRHYLPGDAELVPNLVELARRLGNGLVATNNVHYTERSGQRLHDVLTCIRQLTTLPEALVSGLLHPNSELFLKPPSAMVDLFADLPEACQNTLYIAERCQSGLSRTERGMEYLEFSDQRLPHFAVPPGHTPLSYLQSLCAAGLQRKFDPVTAQAQAQLAHELHVIEQTGMAGYFLVVWDILRFARSRGIRCQGRGSAANSLVAYLLDITPVDPLRHHLLFERFLSAEAHTMPDIDVDFAADRREEVIQYVYERYGEEHTAMVCNVVTYRARSAVREVAKALAFPADVIDRLAKALDTHSAAQAAEDVAMDPAYPWQLLSELLRAIDGIPRHLSIHVGGMLITAAPLVEVVPVERATMPCRVVVQWDKDSVEDAGLIKIDLLSLRTLGMVEETLRHIRQTRAIELDLEHLPLDDPACYEMLQRADTIGCFQVESRAQAQMLPRLKPEHFEDLIIEVALVRPGPIQGHMVHPYLRRRQGLEPVEYAHPSLEPALAETLGVIIFQEQVIRVAMAVARFNPGEADQLRRAMSRSRSEEAMARLRDRFLKGAQDNGLDEAVAAEIFQQLAGFAEFGFCKSHAAAFALVAYQTLYLKAHFAPEFYCALLNHQPMGFYTPEVLLGDAQRHGVSILRPDVNCSQDECTLEPSMALRLGLRYVYSLGEAWRGRLLERRAGRPFANLQDFCQRTRLPRPVVENLIRCGAMDCWATPRGARPVGGQERRTLLWQLGGLDYREVATASRHHFGEEEMDIEIPLAEVALPTLSAGEKLGWEYELLGLAPGDHVMRLYRSQLRERDVLSSAELVQRQDGETVRVAGMVVVRQRPPTAKGHVFITLEDEEGLINLIIRPTVYERYKSAIRNALLLWAEGRLQREGHVISVLVYRAGTLTPGP